MIENGEEVWDNEADTPFKLDEEDWYQCPRRPILDDPIMFADLFKHHGVFERGFLPYPGSYMEQPNRLVELMDVFDRAMGEAHRIRSNKGPGSD